jgi:stress response protein YsnF
MRQQTTSVEQLERMRNYAVYSQDGEKIGFVKEVYVGERSQRPEWIGLGTRFFGTKRLLVPFEGASVSGDEVTVPYNKDQVQDAPDIDSDVIDPETERALYAYYSRGGWAETDDLAETVKQEAVTRSEEELRVGKREEELGHLRIHKWVETEDVEVPVEVRREKARVTREPVDETVSEEAIGEDSLEVTLREERPVVAKETVAKERIGIEKDVEVDRETVEGKVRKERVEVEDDTKRRRRRT